MQKKFLKFAPYLVLLIVFTVATALLAWDIKISQSNIKVSTFLMREKGMSVLQTFESNLISSNIKSKEDFDKLLTTYAEQEDVEFIALANEEGKVLTSNNQELVGNILPLDIPIVQKHSSEKFLNLDFRFDSQKIENSQYVIIQKRLFIQKRLHGHGMGKGMGRRNFILRQQLEQIEEVREFCAMDNPLFLIVGYKTEEILKAQLLDDKKTVINLIGFLFLILLSILSFYLLKKYQQSYRFIEEAKVYFDGLMKTIPLGILTIDNDNKIITCNPIAEKMLNSENLKGKNICDYIPTLAFMDLNTPLVNSLVKTSSSQDKNVELNTFIINIDNERKGIGIFLRDLKEIQKLQEELNRKERLASLGQVTAGIAHEIRNPLSSIKGFARIFEENAKEGSEEKALAQIMNQEISRVDKVISDALEISRPNALSVSKVSVPKLIEQAENALQLQAKDNNVEFKNNIELQELTLDHDKMIQVFHNIFINAMEAMKNGGTITVSVVQEKDNAVISVSDTGSGIEQSKISQLFTPYFTTKAKGTGLGLVIVQKIIEAHKGTIKVESTENEGTTFIISLPI